MNSVKLPDTLPEIPVFPDRVAVTRWLDALPDDPTKPLCRFSLQALHEHRSVAESLVIDALRGAVASQKAPRRGYRAAFLVCLVGEWRTSAATGVLLEHLDTELEYGWDEVIHALTRIGAQAVTPTMFVAFDRRRSAIARRRAIRALASLATAAFDHADDGRWRGNARVQAREICAALRLILSRWQHEEPSLIDEAAERLCELRHEAAWPEIDDLFQTGVLGPRPGFNRVIADDLMTGRMVSFGPRPFDTSMVDWLIGSTRLADFDG